MKFQLNGIYHWFLPSLLLLGILSLTACEDEEDTIDASLLPVASFSASAMTIEAGQSVTFMDNSTNDPTLWKWNFPGGDPTYSNEPNPTVTYPGAGTYTVTMKSRNDFGADEVTMEQYIEVTAPPVVDIDLVPLVRLNFDDNLENAGSIGTAASSTGAPNYGVRPGGGGAYVLNTTNTLIIPGYTGINGPAPRSVSAWVNTESTARGVITNWGAQGTGSRATFALNPNGTIRLEVAGGGINGVTPVNDGEWHHVAYTFDGGIVRMYVDGVEDITWENSIINTGAAGETEVEIGSQLGIANYQGSVDDYRIFAEVLTPEQVKILSEIR